MSRHSPDHRAGAPRLSARQAQLLHLAAQGLLRPPRRTVTPVDLLATLERMRLLQIDTIHVVARSPYLVLFSRLGAYPAAWLDELLAAGDVFECWAHEACFAPGTDFAWHDSARDSRDHHWAMKHARRVGREQRPALDRLLEHIRSNGPVKAADFVRNGDRGSPWWGWKDEKRWLEAAFALGELMIARRENFQRVYDLRERVIGKLRPTGPVRRHAAAAVAQWQILAAVRALGIARAHWIADYFRTRRRHRDADLEPLVADGHLVRVEVAGWDVPGYVHCEHRELLDQAAAGRLRASHTCLLSPFDPVVWDRRRLNELFGFDYTLECYVPAPKRRWGYFVLPILHRGRLVGRLDAKAHRGERRLEIRRLYLEPDVQAGEGMMTDITRAIGRFADWHDCATIDIDHGEPRGIAAALRARMRTGK